MKEVELMKFHFMQKELVLFNMIINKYDTISIKLNRRRPFINVSTKKLVVSINTNKKYYNIAKRYDSINKLYNYFIVLTTEENENSVKLFKIRNKVYIKLHSIWDIFNIYTHYNFNVNVILVESDENTDVYKIEY